MNADAYDVEEEGSIGCAMDRSISQRLANGEQGIWK